MAGMAIPLSKYEKNTKMGNFCFAPNGLGDQVGFKIVEGSN
jgi:hypothetical protein